MIEAKIECHCPNIRFPDLIVGGRPLRLVRGQIKWVPEADARASRELALAKRNGAVTVQWLTRYRVVAKKLPAPKPRAPPWLNRNKRKPAPQPAPPPAPTVDPEAFRNVVAEEVQKALAGLQQPSEGLTQEMLENSLRGVLGSLVVQPGTAPRVQSTASEDGPEEPTFIPSQIVRGDIETNITAKTSETPGEDLDDTMAALKAMRGGGGRRRKRGTDEESDEQ